MLARPNRWVEYETITGRTESWNEGYHYRGGSKLMGYDPGLGNPFEGRVMADNKRGAQEQGAR